MIKIGDKVRCVKNTIMVDHIEYRYNLIIGKIYTVIDIRKDVLLVSEVHGGHISCFEKVEEVKTPKFGDMIYDRNEKKYVFLSLYGKPDKPIFKLICEKETIYYIAASELRTESEPDKFTKTIPYSELEQDMEVIEYITRGGHKIVDMKVWRDGSISYEVDYGSVFYVMNKGNKQVYGPDASDIMAKIKV